ncbi:DUF2971 domain-containing protein [Paenibacillus sp. D9]|uniref:DUF2971 domain-containing protein n=1 Tax=Paenibacillus sp. D9 TaxID=665792 RepID=UPI0009FDF10B|nr:DUF2971 domain-containing protein [Paenibacillus sp. D9]
MRLRDIDNKYGFMDEQEISLKLGVSMFPEEVPKHLFHYTSVEGLQGIINSNSLWATHYSFLNDPTEMIYGIKLLRQVLFERFLNTGNINLDRILEWYMSENFDFTQTSTDTYLISFCESGDLLSQWRGYSNGGGFSIGFEVDNLFNFPPEGVRFGKVIYSKDQQISILTNKIDAITKKYLAIPPTSEEELSQINSYFYKAFEALIKSTICLFKDNAFNEEHEWRVIYFKSHFDDKKDDIKFRVNQQKMIPYVELKLYERTGLYTNTLPIRFIYYGPTLSPHHTEKSIRMFLDQNKRSQCRLIRSRIPFV